MTELGECNACHLRATCTRPVHGRGSINATIAFVGEAPGADEDREGRPFIGRAGQLLSMALTGAQVDEEKVWITNAFHCRPPGNDIRAAEGSPCPHLWLAAELRGLTNLKAIVALGRTAISVFRPGTQNELVRDLAARDTRWRLNEQVFVVGSYHPSAALRGNLGAAESIRSAIARATAYAPRETWHIDD